MDIRRQNLSRVLRMIREGAPITRSALVEQSGLNRVTVFDIVGELHDRGLIQESGYLASGKSGGRPARVLEMDDSRLAVAALELNVDHVALECATLQGRPLLSRRSDIDTSESTAEQVLDVVTGLLDQATRRLTAAGTRLLRVSVACPASIDATHGVVVASRSLGWKDVAVVASLRERTRGSLEFTLDRFANLAVHAERKLGGWAADEGLLMVYGDVGIGGAYQRDTEVLRGDFGSGADFGHLVIDPGGRECYCGRRGCLDSYVGLGPLAHALGGAPDVPSPRAFAETLAALDSPGPVVREEVARQGTWLGKAVSSLVTVFDPSAVVLGGHLTALAPLMMPSFWEELDRQGDALHSGRPQIRVSSLGTSAVLAGGIEAAIQRVCAAP